MERGKTSRFQKSAGSSFTALKIAQAKQQLKGQTRFSNKNTATRHRLKEPGGLFAFTKMTI